MLPAGTSSDMLSSAPGLYHPGMLFSSAKLCFAMQRLDIAFSGSAVLFGYQRFKSLFAF